jgi:hypothetical protein
MCFFHSFALLFPSASPATCFDPQLCVPTSQLPVLTCFNTHGPKQRIWHYLGPRYVFFFFLHFFSFICSIMHICQPPATCFNSQPHFLTIRPRLSTPSHMFQCFLYFFFFLALKMCVQVIVHAFLICFLFFFFSPPQNTCTSHCTRVS